jgi:hypothetical protein
MDDMGWDGYAELVHWESLARGGVWVTKEGEHINIRDMTTKHIQNCLRMLEDNTSENAEIYTDLMIKELARR